MTNAHRNEKIPTLHIPLRQRILYIHAIGISKHGVKNSELLLNRSKFARKWSKTECLYPLLPLLDNDAYQFWGVDRDQQSATRWQIRPAIEGF